MEQRVTRLETKMDNVEDDLRELIKEVKDLNESLARYRGAWGAVVMVGTAMATTVGLGIKFFKT